MEKKKLFISVPMRGREEKDILDSIHRMHMIAEAVFDCELEVLDTYVSKVPSLIEDDRKPIYLLGQSIIRMANADYYIGVHDVWRFRGCNVENDVANMYDIPRFMIDAHHIMNDFDKMFDIDKCVMEARCD